MIGILAFGSLMNDPGEEIASVIVDCKSVRTPFNVEFARSSKTRDGAPTLVPVRRGGFQVPAIVLVCAKRVSEQEATDMLWRRETRKIGTDRRYKQPKRPTKGNVLVKALKPFAGLDVVLYTDFDDTGKFSNPIPTELARLAIESAKASAGAKGLDGISYLAEAKKAGIRTPLMSEYEQEVLKQLGVESLEDAIAKIKAAPLVIYG